jgi:hypothetical protein
MKCRNHSDAFELIRFFEYKAEVGMVDIVTFLKRRDVRCGVLADVRPSQLPEPLYNLATIHVHTQPSESNAVDVVMTAIQM